jgi:amino acid transporter
VLPLTLLVLFGVLLVVLSYREVVSVYTRAGGSYVVARENFGPRVAQVAAVALPTYLFAGSLLVMIVTGLVRELAGGGLPHVVPGVGTVGIGSHSGLIAIDAF